MNIVCSPEQFDALKTKTYRNIPRKLLTTLIKELPDYAVVVYLTLFDLSQLKKNYKNKALISQSSLAKHLNKSTRSIGRALRKLKDEGYIEIQDKINSIYAVNIIRVCCPKSLAEQVIKKEPEDNLASPSFVHCAVKAAPQSVSCEDNLEQTETGLNAKRSLSNEVDAAYLYQQYDKKLTQLKLTGISPLKASQEAFKEFTEEQSKIIQRCILNLDHRQSAAYMPKAPSTLDENVQHIINNNREEQLLLTIDTPAVVDNLTPAQAPDIISDVNLKNSSVVGNAQQHSAVVKKLKAMRRSGEIHHSLQQKYSLRTLIHEVLVHTSNPSLNRTTGFKHALNAAAKMIRQGTWSTPKQLLYWQSLKREQEALRLKQQEQKTLRNAFGTQLNDFVNGLRYSSMPAG